MRDNMSAMPVMVTRFKLGRRADRRVDVAAQRRANFEPVEHGLYWAGCRGVWHGDARNSNRSHMAVYWIRAGRSRCCVLTRAMRATLDDETIRLPRNPLVIEPSRHGLRALQRKASVWRIEISLATRVPMQDRFIYFSVNRVREYGGNPIMVGSVSAAIF